MAKLGTCASLRPAQMIEPRLIAAEATPLKCHGGFTSLAAGGTCRRQKINQKYEIRILRRCSGQVSKYEMVRQGLRLSSAECPHHPERSRRTNSNYQSGYGLAYPATARSQARRRPPPERAAVTSAKTRIRNLKRTVESGTTCQCRLAPESI